MKALHALTLALLVGGLFVACKSAPGTGAEIQAAQLAPGAVVVHATIGGVT